MIASVTGCSTCSRVFISRKKLRVVAFALDQELAGAGVDIADGARGGQRGRGDALAQARRDRRSRRLFDHFLVPPLQRAVALEEMDDVAVRVGEDLDLDVARPLDETLDVQRARGEGALGLAARRRHRLGGLSGGAHDPHALATAAGRGLQQDREPRVDRGLESAALCGRRLAGHDTPPREPSRARQF